LANIIIPGLITGFGVLFHSSLFTSSPADPTVAQFQPISSPISNQPFHSTTPTIAIASKVGKMKAGISAVAIIATLTITASGAPLDVTSSNIHDVAEPPPDNSVNGKGWLDSQILRRSMTNFDGKKYDDEECKPKKPKQCKKPKHDKNHKYDEGSPDKFELEIKISKDSKEVEFEYKDDGKCEGEKHDKKPEYDDYEDDDEPEHKPKPRKGSKKPKHDECKEEDTHQHEHDHDECEDEGQAHGKSGKKPSKGHHEDKCEDEREDHHHYGDMCDDEEEYENEEEDEGEHDEDY
jgi:hypothetical protein